MAASSSSALTGLSMRLISPFASRSPIHSRRSRQPTDCASLRPAAVPARSIACSSMLAHALFQTVRIPSRSFPRKREPRSRLSRLFDRLCRVPAFAGTNGCGSGDHLRSEIRLRGARDREQALVEVILVVLGADRLDQRIGHLAPALDQIERLVEGVGVIDLYE